MKPLFLTLLAASVCCWPNARTTAATTSVVAWGSYVSWPNVVPAYVPSGLTDVVALAGGDAHSLALRANSTVVAWGLADFGPTNVPPGLANVCAIAAGGRHSLALKSDGTVVAWGSNFDGESSVPSALQDVVGIAAGDSFSAALKRDGTVVVWGAYFDGTTTRPMYVPAGLSNVIEIAAGADDCVALKADGTVVGWGWDFYVSTLAPSLTNIFAVAAGYRFGVALRLDGMSAEWGSNGQFGWGMYWASGVGDVAIAAGGGHVFGLKSTGGVTVTGDNSYGQLNVPPGLTNVLAIAAGYDHCLALVGDGSPHVAIHPRTQEAQLGTTVQLFVRATGTPPLRYQWHYNSADLPNETNTLLSIADFQTNRAGVYSVTVLNPHGSVTSSNAILSIAVPVSLEARLNTGDGRLALTLHSAAGRSFQVLATTNLSNPSWEVVAAVTNVTGGDVFYVSETSMPCRFYRLLQLP